MYTGFQYIVKLMPKDIRGYVCKHPWQKTVVRQDNNNEKEGMLLIFFDQFPMIEKKGRF